MARLLVLSVTIASLLAGAAAASEPLPEGDWTKDEVKAECEKYGGTYVEYPQWHEYACKYPGGGELICNAVSSCVLILPGDATMPGTTRQHLKSRQAPLNPNHQQLNG